MCSQEFCGKEEAKSLKLCAIMCNFKDCNLQSQVFNFTAHFMHMWQQIQTVINTLIIVKPVLNIWLISILCIPMTWHKKAQLTLWYLPCFLTGTGIHYQPSTVSISKSGSFWLMMTINKSCDLTEHIDELMQERLSSSALAMEFCFLELTHWYMGLIHICTSIFLRANDYTGTEWDTITTYS